MLSSLLGKLISTPEASLIQIKSATDDLSNPVSELDTNLSRLAFRVFAIQLLIVVVETPAASATLLRLIPMPTAVIAIDLRRPEYRPPASSRNRLNLPVIFVRTFL